MHGCQGIQGVQGTGLLESYHRHPSREGSALMAQLDCLLIRVSQVLYY